MNVLRDAAGLAVGTLTVLPVRPPRRIDRPTAGLAMALAPVAVVPLALAAGGVVWLLDAADSPSLLTAALTVAVLAVGSKGIHLDGLADTADGLAVPGDRERRLAVMRTGDVGPSGTTALLLVLLVQAAGVAGLVDARGGNEAAVAVALAVVASRAALAWACVRGVPAARGDGLGRTVAGSVPLPAALASLACVTALAVLTEGVGGVVAVLVAGLLVCVVLLRARRQLGGVTGDVLGACVELALAAWLASVAVAHGS